MIDGDATVGAGHAVQVMQQRGHHLDQLTVIDIGWRAVHGLQHCVGQDRAAKMARFSRRCAREIWFDMGST